MTEPQRSLQVDRLGEDLHATALKLQDVTSTLQATVREQTHLQEDMAEVRRLVLNINQLLQESTPATPSVLTRLYMVEKEQARWHEASLRTRDWWYKLLATVAAAAIIGLAGVILMLYAATKASLGKP